MSPINIFGIAAHGCFEEIFGFLLGGHLSKWTIHFADRNSVREVCRAWHDICGFAAKEVVVGEETLYHSQGNSEPPSCRTILPNLQKITIRVRRSHISSHIVPVANYFESTIRSLEMSLYGTTIAGIKETQKVSDGCGGASSGHYRENTDACRQQPGFPFRTAGSVQRATDGAQKSIKVVVDMTECCILGIKDNGTATHPSVSAIAAYTANMPPDVMHFSALNLSKTNISDNLVAEILKSQESIKHLVLSGSSVTMSTLFDVLFHPVCSATLKTTEHAKDEDGHMDKPPPLVACRLVSLHIAGCLRVQPKVIRSFLDYIDRFEDFYPASAEGPSTSLTTPAGSRPPFVDIFCDMFEVNDIVEVTFGDTHCAFSSQQTWFVAQVKSVDVLYRSESAAYTYATYDIVLLPKSYFETGNRAVPGLYHPHHPMRVGSPFGRLDTYYKYSYFSKSPVSTIGVPGLHVRRLQTDSPLSLPPPRLLFDAIFCRKEAIPCSHLLQHRY
jgi:hypothetical protein